MPRAYSKTVGRAWSSDSRPRLSLWTQAAWRGVEEVTRIWLKRDLITAFEKLPFYLENLDTFTKLSD